MPMVKPLKLSPMRLLKCREEFISIDQIDEFPGRMRGIYVLYKHRLRSKKFDVVYVGMAANGSIRSRLKSHRKKKKDLWTHCSVFQAWENITPAEIKELEGIFRHIYRKDSRAARLNVQKSYGKMKRLYRILPRRNGNIAQMFPNV
jgi:hypothetical protein